MLALSPTGLCFVKGTNGNFQLGRKGGERHGVRGKVREEAPYTDSIRRDQIKLLASSAPEADKLTVCPIWVSGTVMVRGLGGPEVMCNQLHLHPWGLLTPTVTTTLRDILSTYTANLLLTWMSSLLLNSAPPSAMKMLIGTLGEKVGSWPATPRLCGHRAQGHHRNSRVHLSTKSVSGCRALLCSR